MFARKTVVALNLATFLMMLGCGMTMSLLPQEIMRLSGSACAVGLLASMYAFSFLLLQLPLGRLADKKGFKPFLVWGYLCCCLAGAVYLFSESTLQFFLGRLLHGAGEAPILALAPALLSVLYPQAKGKYIGLYNGFMHLGLTAGPMAGVMILHIWPGNSPFMFFTLACLVSSVVAFWLVEEPRTGKNKELQTVDFKGLWDLLALPKILVVLMGILLYGAGYGVFITGIPTFLIAAKGFSPTSVGLFFTLFYFCISVSQILGGRLSDKKGRLAVMVTGLGMATLGQAVFPWLQLPEIYLPLLLASLGLGLFFVSSIAYLNECVPDYLKGTISGAYFLFWGAGYFLGPMVVGRLGDDFGLETGFYLLSVLFLLETGVVLAFRSEIAPASAN
ncbi:MAG: MFS transporter [Desulfarculaceae bacterium]|jgi:MFS family permease